MRRVLFVLSTIVLLLPLVGFAQQPLQIAVSTSADMSALWESLVFQPLVNEVGGGVYAPALATSWKQEDMHSLLLDVRPGVRFSNGVVLGPSEVVAAFSVLAPYVTAERIDDRTVRIMWPYPPNDSLYGLARWPIVLGPRDEEKADPDTLFGTGPYRVEEYKPGALLKLVPSGSGTLPVFQSIEITVVQDPATVVPGQLYLSIDNPSANRSTAQVQVSVTPSALTFTNLQTGGVLSFRNPLIDKKFWKCVGKCISDNAPACISPCDICIVDPSRVTCIACLICGELLGAYCMVICAWTW